MTTTETERRPTHWIVQVENASVDFAVKTYWGLGTVRGTFHRFDGSFELGDDGPQIELTIEADSLDTGNKKRDEHLRSSDFFHVEQHPHVRFTSTRVHDGGNGVLHVEGQLEAGGQVVPLEFDASVQPADDGLDLEATTAVDQRRLGMSTGLLGMIRPPATLHVKARATAVAAAVDVAA